MNCGLKYTSIPFFQNISYFSRYTHSIHCAKVLTRFVNDPKIIVAGLLHDIATPVFSHAVDFMYGDYQKQEATERNSEDIISKDPVIMDVLHRLQVDVDDVKDYHLYPLADNASPRLSSDRLAYTLANAYNYDILDLSMLHTIFCDLCVGCNEEGEAELMFTHKDIAYRFTEAMLSCTRIYTMDESRYGMEMIAALLRKMIADKALKEDDLYTTEEEFLHTHIFCTPYEKDWQNITELHHTLASSNGICIQAKKRYIDAYIKDIGRITQANSRLKKEIAQFLQTSHDIQLEGVIR